MQERIKIFLNGRYPLFLADPRGWVYFSLLIPFITLALLLMEPFGLSYWHEYHKWMIECGYAFTVTGSYALVYVIRYIFFPIYHQPDNWTRRKEFQNLLFYIPLLALNTWIYAVLSVEEIKFTFESFYHLQKYNGCVVLFTAISFCPFISLKLNTPPLTNIKPKSKSRLSKEQVQNIIQKLNELMEIQQLYLLKKCSQQHVAGITGFSKHQISEAVNTYYHKNFSDFINEYRCKHACKLLEANIPKRLNIEVIGEKCGFQNRVSFQKAFKKIYGMSPSEYQESVNRE